MDENIFDIKNKIENNYIDFLNNNRYNKDIYINNIKLISCDFTASSFPLKFIEQFLEIYIYKYYSNIHSNNILGQYMSTIMDKCKQIIMNSINGSCENDKIIFYGFGASGAISHLVHLIKPKLINSVVFVSIYEHYSNYLSWFHYAHELIILDIDDNGLINIKEYTENLIKYSNLKKNIYISISACSNINGVIQDVNLLSELCHKYNGKIFIDYATSAPYVNINMHTDDKLGIYLDAIFISPHKFPGAQSTPGLLIVNKNIICNDITYTPSGGTVRFCSRKTGPIYSKNIEIKHNGGTPNILGIIRIALAFIIKEKFLNDITSHELLLTKYFQKYLIKIQNKCSNLIIYNPLNNLNRLPIFAIQIKPYHYNFIVILLSDLFGITTRGGINCSIFAQKYLKLNDTEMENVKTNIINNLGVPNNYGWIRITLHSIHTIKEIKLILIAIKYLCNNAFKYEKYYEYDLDKNNFIKHLKSKKK